MKTEAGIRIHILREIRDFREREKDGALLYSDEPEVSVARELLYEYLVTGSDSNGSVALTGIRDAGREALRNQSTPRRLWKRLKRVGFVIYSLVLVAIGYILNLDSVKHFLSELIGKYLK
jgi:hypothetical protein